MDKTYEEKYHLLEEEHWWFNSRREIVMKLIELIGTEKNANILEVGCSGGPLIISLKNKGFENIYGIDISKEGINLCKKRGLKNVFLTGGEQTKFDDEMFDVVIASDVLEHIKNDSEAVKEWARVLKKTGKLIVFTPAYDFLWSDHDDVNHHYKRYTKNGLVSLLKTTGFEVQRVSYWNFSLFFPAAGIKLLRRILKNKNKGEQLHKTNKITNKLLTNLLHLENFVLGHTNLPFGISVFAVGIKK